MRYSLWVSPLINVLLISADGPDSVCCFLFVREMMGSGNGENDCTSEGCKLGNARLRTTWPWLIGIRRKKLKLIISYKLDNLPGLLLFIWQTLQLTNKILPWYFHIKSPFRRLADVFCAALKAWLFMKWIGGEQWHRMETGLVLKGSDPDAWITEHSAAAVGHSGPVKHVLYPLCKAGLKQSTVETAGLSLGPEYTQTGVTFRKLCVKYRSFWDHLRTRCSGIKALTGSQMSDMG